jgi:AraC-like DNA-binding protein/quercetin dioxygenase-like cupin family protein
LTSFNKNIKTGGSMEKETFKESLQHGTTAFPIAVYPMNFSKDQQVLAHLHYHNEFELLVATKGRLLVQTETETYSLSSGEGLFINSGLLHTITATAAPQEETGFIAVVFDYSILCREQDITYENYIRPLLNGSLEPNSVLSPYVSSLVQELFSAYEAKEFGYELSVRHNLLQIFYLLLKDAKPSKHSVQSTKSAVIKTVLDYMKQHYQEPISLQQVAKEAHVSKEYLCRLFHRVSGYSLMEYLNRYRIRQSTFLLLQTEDRISDIALSCGFSHSSYYGKLFLDYIGCTPTEYRKRYQK